MYLLLVPVAKRVVSLHLPRLCWTGRAALSFLAATGPFSTRALPTYPCHLSACKSKSWRFTTSLAKPRRSTYAFTVLSADASLTAASRCSRSKRRLSLSRSRVARIVTSLPSFKTPTKLSFAPANSVCHKPHRIVLHHEHNSSNTAFHTPHLQCGNRVSGRG